jgi:hypothetical protein
MRWVLPKGGGDRRDAAEPCERGVGAQPVDVLAGGDQELRGVAGADPDPGEQRRRGRSDERLKLTVERSDLPVERVDAVRKCVEASFRGLGRVREAGEIRAAWPCHARCAR